MIYRGGAAGGIRTRDHRLSRGSTLWRVDDLGASPYEAGALPLSYGGPHPLVYTYSSEGLRVIYG
ncbi:hypothetical protein apy_13040 [Aeropyrum pernix]|uniref:Uncharacterized protein n=1 Tax=Aeropyrum pernix TaxID=56636 RepID=A0A401HB87_AERPX|nr:hypothetical protein apy_13040 [Aeropyrum pernix]